MVLEVPEILVLVEAQGTLVLEAQALEDLVQADLVQADLVQADLVLEVQVDLVLEVQVDLVLVDLPLVASIHMAL